MIDNIWLVLPKSKELVSPYDLYESSRLIRAAEPFTVSVINTVVAKDLDGFLRGKNDLLILSKSSLGEQPLVDRIHFYEEEIPKGKPIQNIFADTVYVAEDYSGLDRLWLELNILEIDTDTGERKAAVKAFQTLAVTAGAVFPVFVPHAFAASAVVTVVEKLFSALERDKNVIKVPFALFPGEPRPGKAPFQAGTYVAFSQPQDASKFKLESSGLLSVNGKPPADVSYAVFNISPQKQVSPSFVTNQKIATLLTQLKTSPGDTIRNSLDFLNDTLTAYSDFTKLKRFLQLKGKKDLTDDEKTLMDQISKLESLKPFLPKD